MPRVIKENTFIGEPWLLLGERYFNKKEYASAYFCSIKAIIKFMQLGTAWDKRYSFSSYLSAARVLRARSLNLLHLNENLVGASDEISSSASLVAKIDSKTGFPMDQDGIVDLSVFKF